MMPTTAQQNSIQSICPDRSEEIRSRHFWAPGHFIFPDGDVFLQPTFSDRYYARPIVVILL